MKRAASVFFVLSVLLPSCAHADEYGPHADLRAVTFAAKRLLAHRLREAKIDPASTAISDVVVDGNQALLSWSASTQRGIMGLVRYADRWWDALDEDVAGALPCVAVTSAFPLRPYDYAGGVLDAVEPSDLGMSPELQTLAATHLPLYAQMFSASPQPSKQSVFKPGCIADRYFSGDQPPFTIAPKGGTFFEWRDKTSGYAITANYASNNAVGATFTAFRVRAPSLGEIVAYPSPARGMAGASGVMYVYADLDATQPVSFRSGGSLDVWVPWMLDDGLQYEFELYEGQGVVGPVRARVFDNVLHFDLPAFSLPRGETLGEIDAYW